MAIKTNGTLWTWGNNGYKQLGDGTTVHKSSPVQVGALTTWSSIDAGGFHSLAIIEE
jgi:alpha-tubulin suppressor-like RCC1 family protein